MLKQVAVALVTAIVATIGTLKIAGNDQPAEQATLDQLSAHLGEHAAAFADASPGFRFTEELEQDAWLRGMSRDGSPRPGPADDAKPLEDSANSICFLTKVEFTGQNEQGDTTSCQVSIDDFTGWWQVRAIQGDGTDASVACNARCLVWE